MFKVLKNYPLLAELFFKLIFFAFQHSSCSIYPFPSWGSPYQTADHFWPFQNITRGLLEDVQGAAHTIVYNGGKIKRIQQLGTSLYLDGNDDWVDTGGFNADCVTNPSRCDEGFTLGFWLKVYGPGYIMSSGSFTNSKRGPGFRLVYDSKIKGFEFILETTIKRWRIYVNGNLRKWTHMIFSWTKTNGIEYYEDGNLSTYANKPFNLAPRPRRYTPVITIGRPNNVFEVRKFGHFEISQFAIWMKWLSLSDSAGVYMAGVVYDQATAVCCYFKSVGLCAINPCYDPQQCKRIDQTHKCICPRVSLQLKTCKEKIEGYCVDKSSSCNMFARQSKYCEHRTMRAVCPRSCSYCAPGSTAVTQSPPPGTETEQISSSVQGTSPDQDSSSGGDLPPSTPFPNLEPATSWPASISSTLRPETGSSSQIPDVRPSSSVPLYGNFSARKMPRGTDCETLECHYYSYCELHQEGYAQCHCKTDCSLEYAPVCGTNSKTYINKCVLKAESCYLGHWIRVAKKGPCGSRYPDAAHYWPFNATTSSKTLVDVRGKCKTLTYNGVRTTRAEQLGPVLSLDGVDDWILIKGVRSKCINDPTLCSDGLTVSFWLKYNAGEFLLSGGRYTDHQQGPGFRFICQDSPDPNNNKRKHFVLNLSTQTQDWKITLDFLPKAWFHFAFTWHVDRGLKIYKNGKLVVTDNKASEVLFPPLSARYEIITLGRPNSLSKLHNYGKFEIGHLVVWTKELSHYQVEVAFLTVLAKTTKSLICCHFKKADPCVTNPCHDGATCRSIDEKFDCICPDISEGHCEDSSPISPCKDRLSDCAVFARQTGYCHFHKRYMKSKCPRACKFCSSVVLSQKSSVAYPQASPSFGAELTSSTASRTIVSTASHVLDQRIWTTVASPTSASTAEFKPYTCRSEGVTCICFNCPDEKEQTSNCCTKLLDPKALEQGVSIAIQSMSVQEFLVKEPIMKKVTKQVVLEYCRISDCLSHTLNKRARRNVQGDTPQTLPTSSPGQVIRIVNNWETRNTINPASVSSTGGKGSSSPGSAPSKRRAVDVNVVMFSISSDAADHGRSVTAAFYVNVTSSGNGADRSGVLKREILVSILRKKRETYKDEVDILIGNISVWSGKPSMLKSSSTPPGLAAGSTAAPGGSAGVGGQSGGNPGPKMSHTTFIIILVTGIGGFLVLAIIVTFMLVRFLRRMKGEFVPEKVYPNGQKGNGGSDQLIPSFVDPSAPRITDVPKKAPRPSQGGGGGGGGGGGARAGGSGSGKKPKKPMGVKVTYKPPKWD